MRAKTRRTGSNGTSAPRWGCVDRPSRTRRIQDARAFLIGCVWSPGVCAKRGAVRPIGLLALGASVAALGACGGGDNKGDAVVTASAARPSFHRNEPVSVNVTLANHGSAPISASTSDLGTLQVVSLTRDGGPVSPRRGSLSTDEDLAAVLRASVRTVRAGGSFGLSLKSTFDQGVGGQALDSVRLLAGGQNALDLYSVATPGAYVLKLAYEYPAVAGATDSTFKGPTKPAEVSFRVAP